MSLCIQNFLAQSATGMSISTQKCGKNSVKRLSSAHPSCPILKISKSAEGWTSLTQLLAGKFTSLVDAIAAYYSCYVCLPSW